MVDEVEPEGFVPNIKVAGCIIVVDGKVLLLLRSDNKSWAQNEWCLPSAHLIDDESPRAAAIRGVEKDTGIVLSPEQLPGHRKLYVTHKRDEPDSSFKVHYFASRVRLESEPDVQLKPGDNVESRFVGPEEIDVLPVISTEAEIIAIVMGWLRPTSGT